jgi:hypothetical protein
VHRGVDGSAAELLLRFDPPLLLLLLFFELLLLLWPACSSCLDVDNAVDMSAAAVAAGSTAAGTARSFREAMSAVAESLRAIMLYAAAQYSS